MDVSSSASLLRIQSKKNALKDKKTKQKIDWLDAKAHVKLNPDDAGGSTCNPLNNESFRIAWHSSAKKDLCKHAPM